MAELTNNVNFLQPSGFKLTVDRKNYPNLEFFAQSVVHPGISTNAPETQFRGSTLPSTPESLTFNPLSVIILLDEDMNAYTEVQDWLYRLVNTNNVSSLEAANEGTVPSKSDIVVSILSSANNVNKQIKYYDAFPVDLGDVSLEVVAGDQTFITCPVTFKYSRFEII
jgi:hypothetical protein